MRGRKRKPHHHLVQDAWDDAMNKGLVLDELKASSTEQCMFKLFGHCGKPCGHYCKVTLKHLLELSHTEGKLEHKFKCKICHPDRRDMKPPEGPSMPERGVYKVLLTEFSMNKLVVESVMFDATPETRVDITMLNASEGVDLWVMVDGQQHTGVGYGGRKGALLAASDQEEADNRFNAAALSHNKYVLRIHHEDAAQHHTVKACITEAITLSSKYEGYVLHSPAYNTKPQLGQPKTHLV